MKILLAIILALSSCFTFTALSAFTYQGRLVDNGSSASGNYDLEFQLFNASNGGSALAETLQKTNVAIIDGTFAVILDFETTTFNGAKLWLEIRARTNGMENGFVILTPRQAVTPTPYAIHANKAAVLDGSSNQVFSSRVDFQGPVSQPPFYVSSPVHVENLNSDLIDGLDSSAFLLKSEDTVPNIASLRAYAAGASIRVIVLGYRSPGDGGGGIFYWDGSSAEQEDGGTIILPNNPRVTGRWKRLSQGSIKVEWFGIRLGAVAQPDRFQNKLALRRAVDTAIAVRVPLELPAGRLEMDIDPATDLLSDASSPRVNQLVGIRIRGDLQIRGAGKEATTLAWRVEGHTKPCQYFFVDSYLDPIRVSFHDFTLESVLSAPAINTADTFGFLHEASREPDAGADALRFKNVRAIGNWIGAVLSLGGNTLCEVVHCEMRALREAVAVFGGSSTDKRFHVYNSYFADAVESASSGVLLYIHPTINVDIANCRFSNSSRYGIYINGTPNFSPRYVQIANCIFDPSCKRAIQSNKNGPTKITGCTIGSLVGGISLLNSAEIASCTFTGPSAIAGAGRSVIVTGCDFDLINSAPTIIAASGEMWNITSCNFRNEGETGPFAIGITPGIAFIKNCYFRGRFSAAFTVGPGADLFADGNIVTDAVGLWMAAEGVRGVNLRQNEFRGTNYPSVVLSSSDNGVIRGSDNYIAQDWIAITGEAPYQYIQLRKAISPEPLASASSLSPSFNFDTYHVTGESSIETVWIGGQVGRNKLATGALKLIAGGNWSLLNTGNIRPKHSGVRQVNEVVTLVLDSRLGLWFE